MKVGTRHIKFLVLNLFVVTAGYSFLFNSSNPPDGKTGAPGENTCGQSSCHNGGSFAGNVSISGLPATIVGGTKYNITVTVDRAGSAASLAGFQLVALKGDNTNTGNLAALSTDHGTTFLGPKEYVDHRQGGKSFSGSQTVSWMFEWEAPAGPNGTSITLYTSGLLANGANGPNGDNVVNATANGTLTAGASPLELTIASSNLTCFGNNTGSATANPFGGTIPYTYKWSNGPTIQSISNLAAGSYAVTVSDSGGQTITGQVTITQPQALIGNFNNVIVTCANPDPSIIVSAFGGTAPYEFEWNNGLVGSTISFSQAILPISVTITDANGCTTTKNLTTLTIDNSEPVIQIEPPGVFNCGTQFLTLSASATPAGLYQWTTTNGQIISGGATLKPLIGKPGDYTLTVTNPSNGCTGQQTVIVTGTTPLIGKIDLIKPIFCDGDSLGSLQATAVGGLVPYEFIWSNGESSALIDSLPAGNYSVIISDSGSCRDTVSINVSQPDTLSGIINSTNLSGPGSNDGSAILIPDGGTAPYSVLWSNSDTTFTISGLGAGGYTAQLKDTLGCTVSINTFINPFDCNINVGLSTTQVLCNGGNTGSVTINLQGGNQPFKYEWSNSQLDTNALTGLMAGIVSVTITDALGCLEIRQIEITEPDEIGIDSSSIVIIGVSGKGFSDGSITLNAKGGVGPYLYSFQNGGSGTGLPAGLSTVTISDSNNCIKSFQLNVPDYDCDSFGIQSANFDVGKNCFGSPITVGIPNIIGGIPPYSFLWSNGATTSTVTAPQSSINTVSITDSKNCPSIFFINIPIPTEIQLTPNIVNTQVGSNIGSINVVASGGFGPYFFNWSNGAIGPLIQNLSAGNYCVIITDDQGCTKEECFEVQLISSTNEAHSAELNAYPVPFDEYLNVTWELNEVPELYLISMTGQQFPVTVDQTINGRITVTTSGFAKGTYILVLKTDKVLLHKRVIKQ